MTPIQHGGKLPWIQLRNAAFSPVIFRKMIGRTHPAAKAGDLVTVYDRDGKLFGTGMFNPQSQIGLRMVTFDDRLADESLIFSLIDQAIALRVGRLKLGETTDAYRVVHAEGDSLPGLIVDRYGPYAVIELFSLGMFKRSAAIAEHLKKALGLEEVLIRADQRVLDAEGFVLPGAGAGARRERSPDRKSTVVMENGVRFQIDLTHGHKTGFFTDQRDNRLRLSRMTEGAAVLDLCAYTGGFGIYAAVLGKAEGITAVDLDEDAIALAQRNANLNKVARSLYQTVHADSFPWLRQMMEQGKKWDVVVLDPPKFIPSREDFIEGRAKYFDLNKLGLSVVKPGGLLVTCSCSGLVPREEFFAIVRGAARSANKRVQVVEQTGPGLDHPVMTDYPESGYLKCMFCRVLE